MGLKNKGSRPWLSRLHFLVRLLGLTGLLAAAAALVLAHVQGLLGGPGQKLDQRLRTGWQHILASLQGQFEGDLLARAAVFAFLAGAAAAVLWLLVELLGVVRFTAARRSAFGVNVLVQVGVAAVLLVGINVFSFEHHLSLDCTRDRQFTLPADVQQQLRQLRGETTIVILQQRRKTDTDPEFEDYHSAAEAVVVEKVRDLAEQLRQFGPQFRVVLLDARQKDYRTRLAEETRDRPKLAEAIKNAPGNSIFFCSESGKDVQRLSFDDFYQLDRTRSQQADRGKGNLLLLKKGVGPLLTRILNLEEKRPRIGILVVHPDLSTESESRDVGLQGLKKSLTENGFEVRDILVKHLLGRDPRVGWRSTPAADTLEDIRYASLRNRLEALPRLIRRLEGQVKLAEKQKQVWEKATPAQLREDELTEEDRKQQVEIYGRLAESFRTGVTKAQKEIKDVQEELAKIDPDVIGERQHMSDLAKLRQTLADCDLLLIPRLTMIYETRPLFDAGGLYRLETSQMAAIKDFLKEGKPLLACLGPVVDPRSRFAPDPLEDLLNELHIKVSKQAIVYDVQGQDAEESRTSLFVTAPRPVPGLDLKTALPKLRPFSKKDPVAAQDNPLRRSLMLAQQVRGGDLGLRLRYPRPIYYEPEDSQDWKRSNPLAVLAPGLLGAKKRRSLAIAPEFLWTDVACWNDEDPLREDLRFEEPKKDDPARGTRDERRRGPFPVGVAVQATLPKDWYADSSGEAKTARVAVIGHGGVFAEPELPPERAKLLLDTCNWLVGRDDLLTQDAATWSYPRLELSGRDKDLWLWGTRLGLPALFAYLGLLVLLARRVR
jgi:hypothetical protein